MGAMMDICANSRTKHTNIEKPTGPIEESRFQQKRRISFDHTAVAILAPSACKEAGAADDVDDVSTASSSGGRAGLSKESDRSSRRRSAASASTCESAPSAPLAEAGGNQASARGPVLADTEESGLPDGPASPQAQSNEGGSPLSGESSHAQTPPSMPSTPSQGAPLGGSGRARARLPLAESSGMDTQLMAKLERRRSQHQDGEFDSPLSRRMSQRIRHEMPLDPALAQRFSRQQEKLAAGDDTTSRKMSAALEERRQSTRSIAIVDESLAERFAKQRAKEDTLPRTGRSSQDVSP